VNGTAAIRRRAGALLLLMGGCGTPGQNVPVVVPEPHVPSASRQVAAEVGRLLSPDPEESKEAERRLMRLDEAGRADLARHAERIPGERDPRWWNVLDENHLLPDLPDEERLDFLLWKSRRPEPFLAMKAQSGLMAMAREQPDVLTRRLEQHASGARTTHGIEPVVVALGVAKVEAAVPSLLAVYRSATKSSERRAAVEALVLLAGEDRRPRTQGAPVDIARDAARIEAWWQERRETEAGRG
jgi:hypothetical protein